MRGSKPQLHKWPVGMAKAVRIYIRNRLEMGKEFVETIEESDEQ